MLSESIINTYSSWKNNQSQNTFQKPLVKLPPKYTNNPLGMGGTTSLSSASASSSPYLSNSNILLANHSKSVSTAMVPIKYNGVYGNYIFVENQKQDSVIAEDGSEIDVIDIDESEMIDLDSDSDSDTGSDYGNGIRKRDSSAYINLDNYKLNDPIIQFYFGSITVIGLFILFRLMSKTK